MVCVDERDSDRERMINRERERWKLRMETTKKEGKGEEGRIKKRKSIKRGDGENVDTEIKIEKG